MMKVMIAYADSLGDQWGAWVVVALLESALLLGLVGLLWLVIRSRVAPQVGYGLFLLVPLKLLVPVTVTVPAAVACWTPAALASSWFNDVSAGARVAVPAAVGSPAVAVQVQAPPRTFDSAGPRLEPSPPPRPISTPAAPALQPGANGVAAASVVATVTGGSAPVVVEGGRLSAWALAMIAWLVGIVLLLGRLVRAQLCFRAQLRQVSPLDESRLAVDFRELCRLAGVSESIRVVEHPTIAAPAVWGIVRPVILFPQGLASMLSAPQLRWVLLHELAHVRRLDLIVAALQRGVAVLHFYNPALWIANRMIHRLREYACDDQAAALSQASAVESSEAFLRVLRYAGRSRLRLDGALGVFGLDSRASCFQRIHRLLDTERPIRTAPGTWSLWGLILLAVVSVPHLRASEDARPRADSQEPAKGAAPDQSGRKAVEGEDPAKAEFSFTLQVVGPDGRPVPEAVVEFRTRPLPSAEQIRRGTFVKQGPYGTTVKADAEGGLVVGFTRVPDGLTVYIRTPGYGPYWAGWSSETHAEPIPARFTAELDAAWSVGGIVVDAAGKPIEGARVHPSIEFKKRPGNHRQLAIGDAPKTDAAGKWRFDSVPVSMGEVHVAIDHPNFRAVRRPLTRGEFGLERGREPASKVVMEPGLSVTGRVINEAGAPIVGALVRTKFLNEIREAKTGDDGVYKLVGCEPRSARLVVSAKGRATDMKELNIEPEMVPVDFRMKPGGTVRIRVLDDKGQPVPRARIFFQRWRGPFSYFEFDHISQYADKEGVWVWNEAPLDEFQADICSDTGMNLTYRPLISREEEYVFRLPPPLVVTGKVFDAETKEPIKSFRVVPGGRSSDSRLNWVPWQAFSAGDGRFQLREDRESFAHLVRIEADGYRALVSRDIKSDEGNVAIDFAMTRGKGVVAKVVTPDNLPAAGAKIALGLAGSQISLQNGDIDDRSTYCAREMTDQTGRFHFPAQDKDFQLIIIHTSGYAHIKSSPEWDRARIIRLEPWARVEGAFRVGNRPGANAPVTLNAAGLHSYGKDVANIFTHYDVTAGPDGRFVFERVVAGRGSIGRRIMLTVDDGATEVTSSGMITMDFPGGKTTQVALGGSGRPVVGRLLPPDGTQEKVRWNFALIGVSPVGEDGEPDMERPHFTASVDRDGRFRIDDVPAGLYSLSVRFDRKGPGHLLNHPLEVPSPREGEEAGALFDLGSLRLESR